MVAWCALAWFVMLPGTSLSLTMTRTPPPRAVIIPGLLQGSSDFVAMAEAMRRRGVLTTVAPIKSWHWLPMLGGRSLRPILERIDFAVDYLRSVPETEADIVCPSATYSASDFILDMLQNPGGVFRVGGTSDPAALPPFQPHGDFDLPGLGAGQARDVPPEAQRIFLIGHSASGWVSRIYLSSRTYAGRAYDAGSKTVGVVTLGTPHISTDSPALRNVRFAAQEVAPPDVRCLAVAGLGVRGSDGDFSAQVCPSSSTWT